MAVSRREFAAVLAQQVFRASANLVVVPVTVLDAKGQRVAGLRGADFELRDAGRVVSFDLEEMNAPVSVVVLVETAETSGPALEKLAKSGGIFEPLVAGQGGELALISYDSAVRVLAPLSADAEEFEKQFRRLRPTGGGGCMHDAVVEGVRMLSQRPASRRRVMVVIGESKDLGSERKLDAAVTAAQQANVVVYPVTYSRTVTAFTTKTPARGGSGFDILAALRETARLGQGNSAAELARFTGGWVNSFAKKNGLEDALQRISADLHLQYVLSFVPAGVTPGEFRRLEVAVPRRMDYKLRHRPGYWIGG